MSNDKCYICGCPEEDFADSHFDAWCSEIVEKRKSRKTILKKKFEEEKDEILAKIEKEKAAKEEAAKILAKLDKDLEDDKWKFSVKKNETFGDILCAVPAMKYIDDSILEKFGTWDIETYKQVKKSGVVPEKACALFDVMVALNYTTSDCKSFNEDLKYTYSRVKLFSSIKVSDEPDFESYLRDEYKASGVCAYKKMTAAGAKVSICPVCVVVIKELAKQ